jgi:L-fucose isomerase
MGLTSTVIDEYDWINIFGISVEHLDMFSLVSLADKVEEKDIQKEYTRIKKMIKCGPGLDGVFKRSIRLYLALKRIIEENDFDFISLRCTFELSQEYAGACLAQNLLLNEGYTTVCNADERSALTLYMLKLLGSSDSIMYRPDIMYIDRKQKKLYTRTDGIGNLKMSAKDHEPCLSYQYGLESPAGGICLSNIVLKPGDVFMASLSKIDKKYRFHISEGKSVVTKQDLDFKNDIDHFSTTPPWGFIRLKGDIDKFHDNTYSSLFCLTMDDIKKDFIYLCDLLKIDTVFD